MNTKKQTIILGLTWDGTRCCTASTNTKLIPKTSASEELWQRRTKMFRRRYSRLSAHFTPMKKLLHAWCWIIILISRLFCRKLSSHFKEVLNWISNFDNPLCWTKSVGVRSCVIMMRSVIILIKSDQSGDSKREDVKRVPFFILLSGVNLKVR